MWNWDVIFVPFSEKVIGIKVEYQEPKENTQIVPDIQTEVKSEGQTDVIKQTLPDQHDHAYHTNFEVRKSTNF